MPIGIKDLKDEFSKMNSNLEELTKEINDTKITIRDSLKLTSDTLKEMTNEFTKALKDVMIRMSDMSVQMNVRDSIISSLGIESLIPDFLKKKKS